jgi:hypothetical protein
MKQYKVFGPDAEVLGAAMLAFVESMNYPNFMTILAKHGLHDIYADLWYPQQIWLDVFSDIANRNEASSDLVSIGMKIVDTAPMPPEMQTRSFVDIMMNFNAGSYLANNRGRDIGGIQCQILSEQHLVMIDRTPYPDDFIYGAYYAMARRFLGVDVDFTVKFDEQHQRRDQGGRDTRVHIIWEQRTPKAR